MNKRPQRSFIEQPTPEVDCQAKDRMPCSSRPVGLGILMDIANMALFLCSDKAGFITGENICIDGGMTKLMIYHDDHGWTYTPEG